MVPVLLLCSGLIVQQINSESLKVLIIYFFITLIYSLYLKKLLLLDVICLALLYTIRLVAGHFAANVSFSWWLLNFSMFLFLSLAILKRYNELVLFKDRVKEKIKGRAYYPEDLPVVAGIGAAAGISSVLIFSLYINSQQVVNLYKSPELLFLAIVPLLYWIARIWLLAGRGEINQDPILFAVKDRHSYFCLIILVLIIVGAS